MTLLVIRHGESRGNHLRIIQGTLDEPLTETGVVQAAAVARRLARHAREAPPAALYSSPLVRASATAEAIAERLGLPVVSVKELQERHFGEAQGLTGAELGARWPSRASHDEDWASAVPGVEQIIELRSRAATVLEALLDQHEGETAVVVSHGGTISQMVAHVLGLAPGTLPRIRLGNTSVTIFEGPAAKPVITLFNDNCHLRAEEQTAPPAT